MVTLNLSFTGGLAPAGVTAAVSGQLDGKEIFCCSVWTLIVVVLGEGSWGSGLSCRGICFGRKQTRLSRPRGCQGGASLPAGDGLTCNSGFSGDSARGSSGAGPGSAGRVSAGGSGWDGGGDWARACAPPELCRKDLTGVRSRYTRSGWDSPGASVTGAASSGVSTCREETVRWLSPSPLPAGLWRGHQTCLLSVPRAGVHRDPPSWGSFQ